MTTNKVYYYQKIWHLLLLHMVIFLKHTAMVNQYIIDDIELGLLNTTFGLVLDGIGLAAALK